MNVWGDFALDKILPDLPFLEMIGLSFCFRFVRYS
jgi:hypothetical protein